MIRKQITLRINENLYDQINNYCRSNAYIRNKFLERIIAKRFRYEKNKHDKLKKKYEKEVRGYQIHRYS